VSGQRYRGGGCDQRVGEREHGLGIIGLDRKKIKVAYRVGEGELIGVPRKGSGVGQPRASGDNWAEGWSRRTRVTFARWRDREDLEYNNGGDFIVGKAARGGDT
jgi:hypothetical protein